jgi:hypothetical protein
VKLARFRRSKVACVLSYVKYKPNTNAAILKRGHIQEREGKKGS